HVDGLDLRPGCVEDEPVRRGRLGRGPPAVELIEERGQGRGNCLHQPDALRLARAVVRCLRDHPPRRQDIAVVLAGELSDIRGRVVDDLAAQVAVDVPPPSEIGVDEPMFVCGAMAARSEAMVITAPAESALDPGGETYMMTGTVAERNLLTMPRMDELNPPGVSSTITTAAS